MPPAGPDASLNETNSWLRGLPERHRVELGEGRSPNGGQKASEAGFSRETAAGQTQCPGARTAAGVGGRLDEGEGEAGQRQGEAGQNPEGSSEAFVIIFIVLLGLLPNCFGCCGAGLE